jgi:hypothetical protein
VTAQWDKRLNAASFENGDNGKQRDWLNVAQRLGFNTAIPIASVMIWAMERCAAVECA